MKPTQKSFFALILFYKKAYPYFLKIAITRNIIGVDDVGFFESVRR